MGKVISKYVCGVGYKGQISSKSNARAYRTWKYLLERCYRYDTENSSMDTAWLSYEKFLEDLVRLDGYDEEKYNNGELQLETKPIQETGKTVYSKDTSRLTEEYSKYKIGSVVTNKHNQTFTIISKGRKSEPSGRRSTFYMIRFNDTTYERLVGASTLYNECYIKDPFKPSHRGIGYLGNYTGSTRNRHYSVWAAMLSRCYNPKSESWHLYGGAGVTVDPRWHSFENFNNDIRQLEGYDETLFSQRAIELDKDTKQDGVEHKIYSKDTCIFLPCADNVQLARCKTYKITDPAGEEHIVKTISKFCEEKGLCAITMRSAATVQSRKLTNGWKIEIIE